MLLCDKDLHLRTDLLHQRRFLQRNEDIVNIKSTLLTVGSAGLPALESLSMTARISERSVSFWAS
jgi:hypothetical protein